MSLTAFKNKLWSFILAKTKLIVRAKYTLIRFYFIYLYIISFNIKLTIFVYNVFVTTFSKTALTISMKLGI